MRYYSEKGFSMRSHLTVSLELIAFIKWLLKNRKDVLHDLVEESMSDDLLDELEALNAKNAGNDDNNAELYDVVNEFVSHLEEDLVHQLRHVRPINLGDKKSSLETLTDVNLQNFDADDIIASTRQTDSMTLDDPLVQEDDQLKRHMLLKNLLNNWQPIEGDEVN